MGRKGQAINIDWTIGLGLFLLTALTTVLFVLNAGISGNDVNSLTSKAYEIQNAVEEQSSISGKKTPIITRGPENISKIPVDRSYTFGSNVYPGSGSGNIPVSVDVAGNRVITVTDAGNLTNYIAYFSENVSEINYDNDISTGEWINNSKISVKPGSPGLQSLMVSGNSLLNSDADLGSGTYSTNEQELHAETLSGDLRVYNGSNEMILTGRSSNITFNLNNLDTLYWHEDGSTTSLTGTGSVKEGSTKGFTIASDYGITFLGDLTATVSKPDSSTVRAEIDAEKVRIRLHDSSYESGQERIRFYDEGRIVLGASQPFSAPYKSKIKQLDSMSETDFENSLNLGGFNYKIGFGRWIQNLINELSDWNQGKFNATSASRKDNSGDLALGYRNGSSGDSLVGYWRMDRDISGDGGIVKDYSGERNDGSSQNGIKTGVAGIFGTNSSDFDGSDDKVKIPLSNSLRITKSITLSAWVKTSNNPTTEGIIDTQQSSKRGYRLTVENSVLEFGLYGGDVGSGYTELNGNKNISDGSWHHVVGTWDGENMTVYVDGEEDGTATQPDLAEPDQDLYLAVRDVNNGYLDGKIDSIRIYNEYLTQSEIQTIYFNGRDGTFNGEYFVKNQTDSFQEWEGLRVDADIPDGTDVEVVFESLDIDNNTVDRQIIDLKSEKRSYSIDSDSSTGYRITFRGSSNDPEKSWEIKDYKLKYGPELSRGMNLPLDTSTVVLNRGTNIVDRNGSFSSIENRVVLWR